MYKDTVKNIYVHDYDNNIKNLKSAVSNENMKNITSFS